MAEYIMKSSPILESDSTPLEVVGELTRCKDCKHRPRRIDESGYRFNLEFPDYRCPCRCEDDWSSWMPDDDWFCGNGERKE